MSNPNGRFGVHGGQYVPETLMNAIIELEEAYDHYKAAPDFQHELTQRLTEHVVDLVRAGVVQVLAL